MRWTTSAARLETRAVGLGRLHVEAARAGLHGHGVVGVGRARLATHDGQAGVRARTVLEEIEVVLARLLRMLGL